MFDIHDFLSTETTQLIAFVLFLYLCANFLDVLRCLKRSLLIKLCFICLTLGSFCISIYAVSHPVSLTIILLGVGLLPLGINRVRYGS